MNALSVPAGQGWSLEFDRPIDVSMLSAGGMSTFGRNSGEVLGAYSLADEGRTLRFEPTSPLSAGEQVTVQLPAWFAAQSGALLGRTGYAFQYTVATRPVSQLDFVQVDSHTTNITDSSRPYGGVAADWNRDGWIDLGIVNEDTADLRVFMNIPNGGGTFGPALQPTVPTGIHSSPSDVADFNRDGFTDMVVANPVSGTVSILMGFGDGTFSQSQHLSVGGHPRGVGVFDMDGDGDVDIANANSQRNGISFLENDGTGQFTESLFIDGGVDAEWPLAVADMNRDGILDIVVGGVGDNSMRVLHGNGDGSFSPQAALPIGGAPWQISLGDINGDGWMDATSANSWSHTGTVVLGNGTGAPPSAVVYPIGDYGSGNPVVTATDLGDLDGDGDLDWVTSSFMGNWVVMLNDGMGHFDFFREIDAPGGAACSILFDVDNDHDLDLALIDEVDDLLFIYSNRGNQLTTVGDLNGDSSVDALDAGILFSAWGTSGMADVNLDGVVDAADAGVLFEAWTGDLPSHRTAPEPSSFGMACLAIAGLAKIGRFRSRCANSPAKSTCPL